MLDITKGVLAILNRTITEPFLGNKGRNFHPPKINSNLGLSSIKEKVHKDLEVLKTQLNNFPSYVQNYMISYLRLKAQSFKAGQVALFYEKWMQLTSLSYLAYNKNYCWRNH